LSSSQATEVSYSSVKRDNVKRIDYGKRFIYSIHRYAQ
jgi:hypothetical protein